MRTLWIPLGLSLASLLACSSSDSPPKPCADASNCQSRLRVSGPTHGLRPDKRVDVSASEAWPSRPTEPPFPSQDDLAKGCASIAACLDATDIRVPGAPTDDDGTRASFTAACGQPPALGEENGIPMLASNERLSYLVGIAVSAKSDCAKIKASFTKRPTAIRCESHGCEWFSTDEPLPNVVCNGTVATLTTSKGTYTRDCSHAFTTCDTKSPTGCVDRPLVKCDPAGKDRCDGTTHLGCRLIGFVSMRDCARMGGTCKEDGPETATCDYGPACGVPGGAACEGNNVKMCSRGKQVLVDCVALGFTGCSGGHCK